MEKQLKEDYEYWKKQHDKWHGKLSNNPTPKALRKFGEAYDKMMDLKKNLDSLKAATGYDSLEEIILMQG